MSFMEFAKTFRKEVMDEAMRDLAFIAQGAYETAISSASFAEQTGALKSSIGWAVCRDGAIVHSGGFESHGSAGSEGTDAGKSLLKSMPKERGISVILVAGMHYASYVESKGFDVNTSGELLLDEMVQWWINHA